jgi:hypothetical protein
MADCCDVCGRIEGRWERVLSRHRTSEGEVVYTRCSCGSVAVRLLAPPWPTDGTVLTRGPAAPDVAPLLATTAGNGP